MECSFDEGIQRFAGCPSACGRCQVLGQPDQRKHPTFRPYGALLAPGSWLLAGWRGERGSEPVGDRRNVPSPRSVHSMDRFEAEVLTHLLVVADAAVSLGGLGISDSGPS